MKPLAKRLLKWTGIALGALVLLVAVAPTLMPTGWIKDLIAKESEKALGAPVTVERISLGWISGATLEGIRVPNAAGYSPEPLATVARLHVDADLPALLSKRIHLRSVSVEGLEVSLERRDKDGAWNAQGLQPASPAPASTAPAAPLPSIAIDALSVSGGIQVRGNGKTLEAKDLKITAVIPSLLDQPVTGKLSTRLAAGEAAWDVDAAFDASPFQGPKGNLTLTLKGAGLGELLAPLMTLPMPLSLEPSELTLSASLKNGQASLSLKEGRLGRLVAGPLSVEGTVLTLDAGGPFKVGELRMETDLQLTGLEIPGPRGRVRIAGCHLAHHLQGDLQSGHWTLRATQACGSLSGSVEGEVTALPGKPPSYHLKQVLKGDLAELTRSMTGLIPEGASFTGILDSALTLTGDGRTHCLSGTTALPGFSVKAPGLDAERADLLVTQKLLFDQGDLLQDASDDRLAVESLLVRVGPEGSGPLDLSLAGAMEDPAHLGRLDLSGTARADLARLQAIAAGYFSATPGFFCAGAVEGSFVARGNQGQASFKGKLALTRARFQGGPFGESPLDVPEAHLAADLDVDRGESLRVAVRTLEASTPFFSAGFREGFLVQPPEGPGQLKGDLDIQVKDLDAATRFLRGPLPQLREYQVAGSGTLKVRLDGSPQAVRASVEGGLARLSASSEPLGAFSTSQASLKAQLTGPPAGPWTLAEASLKAADLRYGGPLLPGPLSLSEFTLALKQVLLDPAGPSLSAGSVSFASPFLSVSCALKAQTPRLEVTDLEASADLAQAARILAACKLLPKDLRLAGQLKLTRGALSGTAEALDVAADLAVTGLSASGGPLPAPLREPSLSLSGLSASLSPARRSLSLKSPLLIKAPALGLTRCALQAMAVGDWSALSGIRLAGLEVDLDAGPALKPFALEGSGPVALRVPALAGSLSDRLEGELSLDASAAALAFGGVRKPGGTPLAVSAKGALAKGLLTLARAELTAGPVQTALESGSVIPMDLAKDARIRLRKTSINLAELAPWVPDLKRVSGTVTLEGALEGPLAMPGMAERLRPDLSLTLDKVGLSYTTRDGKEVPVSANGALRCTRKTLSLDGLLVSFGEETLSLTGEVQDPLEAPSGRIEIQGGAFDLDKLLAFQPKAAAPGTGAPAYPSHPPRGAAGTAPAGLLPAPFDKADLDLVLTLKEIVWKANKLSELDSRTSLKQGHLRAETKAVVNEGPVRILVDLDTSQKDPPFAVELSAKDIRLDVDLPEIRYILPVLAGGKVTGKATLDPMRLEGQGGTWDAILGSLHTLQDAHLQVGDGEVKGSRMFSLIGSVLRQPALEDLRFDAIDATFNVKDRQINNVRTLLHSSAGNVISQGWVHFDTRMEQKVVLDGDFLRTGYGEDADRVMAAVMGEGGILIEGTVTAPKTRLDTQAILKSLAKEAGKELLKRGLEDWLKRR